MRIHFLSNSLNQNSGFGNVTKNLALGLKKLGHEVTVTGEQTMYTNDWYSGIEILPLDTKYLDEVTQFAMNIREVNPDVVIYVGQVDSGEYNNLLRVFTRTVLYIPIEGRNISEGMARELLGFIQDGKKIVAQTYYGHREMAKVGVESDVIYHGFNEKIFYPMNDLKGGISDSGIPYCYYNTEAGLNESEPRFLHERGCYDCTYNTFGKTSTKDKCESYKEENVLLLAYLTDSTSGKRSWTEIVIPVSNLHKITKGKFVYLMVGQNFGIRKHINRLIKAYARLIDKNRLMKDRTLLWLHCKPIAMNGENLLKIVAELGISNNVIFSYGSTRSNAFSEEAMARIYNLSDVQVQSSSSEGFGLANIESMACRKCVIAPDCSSFTELIGNSSNVEENRGLLAKIATYHNIVEGSERALVDIDDLSLKMFEIYNNDKLREKLSNNGLKWVQGKYRWDNIVKEWDKLLKEYVSGSIGK